MRSQRITFAVVRPYFIIAYKILTMYRTLLLLLIITMTHQLSAQFGQGGRGSAPKIKGKISGVVIDSTTNLPVSFATISMKKHGRTKIVNGTLSDEDGSFSFTDVNPGKYDLEVSFIGYTSTVLDSIVTSKKKPDYNVGSAYLVPVDYLLDEVEVTAKRALIENKIDKIVFNAEDDSSVAGGDATDVLRKVPLLSVDLDGNVSLRGSQNVRILINGKPSGMFSTNVADALKMFPADQIKKVEVISSPGAKYDGEGSAGIINIVTKKENIEGVAGTINASGGNRQNNANVTLNVGKGRFGFTTNASVFYSNPVNASNTFERVSDSGELLYLLDGTTRSSRLGFNGSASAFYDINAYNSFNSSFTLRGFGFDQNTVSDGLLEAFAFDRITIGDNLTSGFDLNLDYTRKFESNDTRELVIAGQISGNIQNQDNTVTDLLPDFTPIRNDIINNEGDNLEYTLQVDLTEPITKGIKLETGLKTVIRRIDSDSEFTPDDGRSNLFLYDQDVFAGYASASFAIAKLNFVTGLRFERTDINGDGEQTAQQFENGYNNFLPNIAVSKSFKNFRTLKLSYSQRIQRPSLFFINPFLNVTDFGNVSQGNPVLDPELVNQYEIGYNTNILGLSIFANGYYRQSTNLIESVATLVTAGELGIAELPQDREVSLTSFLNVGENNSIGINLFTSKSIKKLTLRGGGDVFTYNATGTINGRELSNSAISYRLFTNGEFSFSGTLKADFFGFFQAPQFTLQGENPSFSIFGVGFRKDFKDWSLGIRIIEPFAANKSFNSDIQGDGFRQVSSFVLPFRSFGLNVRYKFGKVDFTERRSKVRNTDTKQGDGQGGQGGGGGGPVGG